MWAKENGKWLAWGILAVVGLYAVTGATLVLIIQQFWPKGAPVDIQEFGFRTPIIESGGRASIHVEFEKFRNCQPAARLVFINAAKEERQFLFPEWPTLSPGNHAIDFRMDVPQLEAGKFTAEIRIIYDCQESDYIVVSPTDDVEIVEPEKGL